ncbi:MULTISPECIES: TniQ family protein [unclassified Dietzia]|uniref:TniQ family protein n=1 Tax=unclassified Dietzia TaxID=2617939 RepID=UPI0015F7E99B|nr:MULTISPECIES: TniQ family protein [unclassified Dietzia]MBB1026074.1 TniQ family protein [Dietzia sp. DQ12-76]MBB1029054.1 TniQ family protein [Dietzia sp. DQ11-38-2]
MLGDPAPMAITRMMKPGQDLHSFIEAVAGANGLSTRELLRALGVGVSGRPYELIEQAQRPYETMGIAFGVPAGELELATFASLPHRELKASDGVVPATFDNRGERTRGRKIFRRSGARWCPECLRERDGSWRLSWFLPVSVACIKHAVLLNDRCPVCDRIPHSGENRLSVVPANPNRCLHVSPDKNVTVARTRITPRCNADLTLAASTYLGPDHPYVAAQRVMNEILARLADHGMVQACGLTVPVHDVLSSAIQIINALVMNESDLTIAVTSNIAPGRRISAGTGYVAGEHGNGPGPIYGSQLSAAEYGALMTSAIDVISAPSLDVAAHALERYEDLGHPPPVPGSGQIRPVPQQQSRNRGNLTAAIRIRSRQEQMKVADRLTHRTSARVPRLPAEDYFARPGWPYTETALQSLSSRHLPQSIWPDVLSALPAVSAKDTGAAAVTYSMLLARIGTRERWFELAASFNLPRSAARTVSAHLQRLDERGVLEEALDLLDRQWESLLRNPPPIDYDRRRWTFRRPPALDGRLLEDLKRLGFMLTPNRERLLATRLWELLTGSDNRYSVLAEPLAAGRERTEYRHMLIEHSSILHDPLQAAGRRQLQVHGIREPLEWSPISDNPDEAPSFPADPRGETPEPSGPPQPLAAATLAKSSMADKALNTATLLNRVRDEPESFTRRLTTFRDVLTGDQWSSDGKYLIGHQVKRLIPDFRCHHLSESHVEDIATFLHAAVGFLPPWQPDHQEAVVPGEVEFPEVPDQSSAS